ncbi:MAG TPA: HAMP domain-containing sensor histidine kinase, partial [Abditibacterium sp.]
MTAFDLDAALHEVATHLGQRRPQLLARWRECVAGDEEIAGSSLMTRSQFYNHMPWLLASFGHKLKTMSRTALEAQHEQEAEIAQQHSHHRWQQGYSMRSLVREWGHLNTAMVELLNEIPAPEAALARARVLWAEFVNHSISEGVNEYQSQLQIEAKGRLKDLEDTVETVRGLETARAEMLRQVSHDLRGSLSMVAGASSLLGRDAIGGSDREQVISIMQGGVRSVSQMLTHLMDVSRLEAGQEVRTIESFDAGQILQELCNNSQMLADEKGLWMTIEGPESLPVEGDLSKVQRIAQNLLLNALKYTQS